MGVPFEPGVLKAVSRLRGKVVLTKTIATAGAPVRIELIADRTVLRADGDDLAFVTIRIVDTGGNPVPDAMNDLRVTVSGAGMLAGMDNGYQADLSSFRGSHHRAYNGLCLAIVRASRQGGGIVVHVTGQRLKAATVKLMGRSQMHRPYSSSSYRSE